MISVHTCPLAKLGSKETGGMNVYVRELSRHLGARGVQVDVFTRRQDISSPAVVELGANARVIHLEAGLRAPMDKYRVLEHLPQFLRGVKAFISDEGTRYDLIHSHYWLSSPVAWTLARDEGIPLITMFHTLGKMKNKVSSSGDEREHGSRVDIERAAMAVSDRIVAASPTDREQMVGMYGAAASAMRVVPAGVDTSLFRPLSPAASRATLGMGPELQILFVGRIQALKGIDLLLRSFAQLLDGWEGAPLPRLTVVGGKGWEGGDAPESREMSRLKRLGHDLGIQDQLTFREAVPQEQLPVYYSAADLVVVPSLYESFGLVALEAMACGAPVVAARVGGLQWTVQHGRTGLLVPERSPRAYAEAIGSILRNPAIRSEMSRASVAAAAEYSWESVTDSILGMYDDLTHLRPRSWDPARSPRARARSI